MPIDYAEKIAAAVSDAGVTGASFAYFDGHVLHEAVAGLRNSVTGDVVTSDTLMHIGSITKVINACLFMQLVDDGLVELDDLVSKHLPELRLGDPLALQTLTCRMLLNHSSGIDFDCPDYEDFEKQRIDHMIRECEGKFQVHAPGEATSYSNIGTVIAGYMCQELRGEGWYSLVKSRIFEPLGLQYSITDITEVPRFRVSVGDQVAADGKLVQSVRPFLPLGFAPAGATTMMTAADLVTFARALMNGGLGVNGTRILSDTSAALMTTETRSFASPLGWRMGLGWMLLPGGVVYHGGGGPGVVSELFAQPSSGRVFALLTNCSKFGALTPSIVNPILASWDAAPAVPTPMPVVGDTNAYEGAYENQLTRWEIFRDGETLSAQVRPKIELFETDNVAYPTYELKRIGDHLFQPMVNGVAAGYAIALIDPGPDGLMRRLGTAARIFNRV